MNMKGSSKDNDKNKNSDTMMMRTVVRRVFFDSSSLPSFSSKHKQKLQKIKTKKILKDMFFRSSNSSK